MARILGIDYGTKRVGLAVTDPMQIIASPLTTVDTPQALDYIAKYIAENEVERILIGYPTDLQGRPTDATFHVEGFIKAIQKRLPEMPLQKWDESYTSRMAMQSLVASGIKKKQRRDKKLLDQVSAAIILQEYLQNL
ncbi:MAG TPA: Holliday junction resolvase RuvX [Chitinophagales bacterium]|nr:Holliday junction resolvase RuvX [Chitinophagales bacterium]HMX03980.1 Holliday junction resolvase RuvX [Chitinophagales bacterium]HMZ89480.1 Holliday junction resolvase RuvX [Chitinophagales bacterium]HNA57478.1 Holliday junction resolvase RuvX [Chitinophagales bacterium]HNE46709.1 Holliday junction resolvase RuvX [Chitinophagales bacterium]